MKVMISQPMLNRNTEDILEERKNLINKFNNMHIEVINTFYTEDISEECNNDGVYFLGKSIKDMSKADALFMCKGWKDSRGCRIERLIAQEYGIKILYEDFFINKPEIATRKV